MSGAVTIQIQDTGGWTLDELKIKLEEYVLSLTKPNADTAKKNYGRKFGIAKTKDYWIAPDFNDTPDEFKDYL